MDFTDKSKSDAQFYHEFLQDESMDGFKAQVSYNVDCCSMNHLKAEKIVRKGFLRFLTVIRKCNEKGHDWESTGSFGPDSGMEYITCTRCGESHRGICY